MFNRLVRWLQSVRKWGVFGNGVHGLNGDAVDGQNPAYNHQVWPRSPLNTHALHILHTTTETAWTMLTQASQPALGEPRAMLPSIPPLGSGIAMPMPESSPTSMIIDLVGDVDVDAGAMESSTSTRPASHDSTKQATIRFNRASPHWIFQYRLRDTLDLYVMGCPRKSCLSSTFSRHPLKDGRAEKHLRNCGQQFTSEEDMIRRYARLGKYPELHVC